MVNSSDKKPPSNLKPAQSLALAQALLPSSKLSKKDPPASHERETLQRNQST